VTQRQVAENRRRAVGDYLTGLDELPLLHDGTLVDARRLVGSVVLAQAVRMDAALGFVFLASLLVGDAHHDLVACDRQHLAGLVRDKHLAGIVGGLALDARADNRDVRLEQRDGLTLHVRAHQRAVCVVVLQERDQRGGNAHDLARSHVHIVDTRGGRYQKTLVMARRDAIVHELVLRVQRCVCLRNREAIFFVCRKIDDLVAHKRADRHRLQFEFGQLFDEGFIDHGARGNHLVRLGFFDIGAQLAAQDRFILERHLAVYAAIRRLDEPVFVHAPVAR